MYPTLDEKVGARLQQIVQAKARLRQSLVARRAALPEREIVQKSVAIASYVCALSVFCESRTIMVYLALAHEVQTARIIAEAQHQHKRVAVPMIHGSTLVPVEFPRDAAQLRRGPYGILEPCGTPIVPLNEIQYVAVPGVAFDRRGERLGFGKGYYDRFLRSLSTTAYYCGLAFGMQIVACVPHMPHDVCMHGVVTEQGFIPCIDNSTGQPR